MFEIVLENNKATSKNYTLLSGKFVKTSTIEFDLTAQRGKKNSHLSGSKEHVVDNVPIYQIQVRNPGNTTNKPQLN